MQIGRRGPLGHDTLPALSTRLPMQCLTLAVPMRGEAKRIGERDDLFQQMFTCAQRDLDEPVAVQVQEVEEIVVDGHGALASLHRIVDPHPFLQTGEARDRLLERHDLSVENECGQRRVASDVCRLFGAHPPRRPQGVRDLRIGAGHVLAVARHETELFAVTHGQNPLSVELRLEYPFGVRERLGSRNREHGPRLASQRLGCQPRALLVGQPSKQRDHGHSFHDSHRLVRFGAAAEAGRGAWRLLRVRVRPASRSPSPRGRSR